MRYYPTKAEQTVQSLILKDLSTSTLEKNDYYYAILLSGYNLNKDHFEIIYNKSIYSIDLLLVLALIAEESSFKQYAINRNKDNSKDFGYFQLNDRWHPQYKTNVNKHIEYGINFLKWCLQVEKGNIERALSRYNSGNPNSKNGLEYAKRVLKKKESFENVIYYMFH